jgi:hypothetical protein
LWISAVLNKKDLWISVVLNKKDLWISAKMRIFVVQNQRVRVVFLTAFMYNNRLEDDISITPDIGGAAVNVRG